MTSAINRIVVCGALIGMALYGVVLGAAGSASATPARPGVNTCGLPTSPSPAATFKRSFRDCDACQVEAFHDIARANFRLRFYCVYNDGTGLSDEYWNFPTHV